MTISQNIKLLGMLQICWNFGPVKVRATTNANNMATGQGGDGKSFSLLVHEFEASVLDPLGIARTCGQYGIPLATCHMNAAIK